MQQSIFVLALTGVGILLACFVLMGLAVYFAARRYSRQAIQTLFNSLVDRLLVDDYGENLAGMWSAIQRTKPLNIVELSLRTQTGVPLMRPMGSRKRFNHYDNLMFVPAQMARLPVEVNVAVDMSVKLGPKAKTPLELKIPLLIGGMGYGVALSEKSKIALAKATRITGTALNSGEGPFLAEERKECSKYIWQIGRTSFGREPKALAAADMVEVQMGQGSSIGGHTLRPQQIKGKAQKLMGVSPLESVSAAAVMPGISNPWDWAPFVRDLRREIGGKPVGLKIMAGGRLEADLAVAIEAGFDVIALDGAQAGTFGSVPILSDDFGIPSINALVRAQRYLLEQGVRRDISLIVGGGYLTPGECLKALALGADAVYLGTVPLFALVHRQIDKVLPWEPLLQLIRYDSRYNTGLDVELAAQNVANVLHSFVLEMEIGIRALGKRSLGDLGPNDLVALDEWTAELTGVPRV